MTATTRTRALTTLSAVIGVAIGVAISLKACSVLAVSREATRVEVACAALRASMERYP